jgi:hypothetical protein
VNHTKVMVEGDLGSEEVRDRSPMPHAVMVHKVMLQPKGPFENIHRRRHDFEVRA